MVDMKKHESARYAFVNAHTFLGKRQESQIV
jgi:hypothetical protein